MNRPERSDAQAARRTLNGVNANFFVRVAGAEHESQRWAAPNSELADEPESEAFVKRGVALAGGLNVDGQPLPVAALECWPLIRSVACS